MKIIQIYSGFFFQDFYFKYEENEGNKLNIGDLIIFKSGENIYRGEVKNTFKDGEIKNNKEDFSFIRKCSKSDLKEIEESKEREYEYLNFFGKKTKELKLDLEKNTCELSFDDKMLLFSYTSEERIDFRELVKSLAGVYRRRIQLKQLGLRDKAALFGGYGVCGQELCCSRFLKKIPSVPIHAPKVQDLMYKDMDNLVGVCGKLKCCLNYEIEQYQDIKKNMPNIGSVATIDGKRGIIIGMDIFSQKIKIKFQDSTNIFDLNEIREFLEKKIGNKTDENKGKKPFIKGKSNFKK